MFITQGEGGLQQVRLPGQGPGANSPFLAKSKRIACCNGFICKVLAKIERKQKVHGFTNVKVTF